MANITQWFWFILYNQFINLHPLFAQFMPCLSRQLKTMLGQVSLIPCHWTYIAPNGWSSIPSVRPPVSLSYNWAPVYFPNPCLPSAHLQNLKIASWTSTHIFPLLLCLFVFFTIFVSRYEIFPIFVSPVYTCTLFILLLPILTAHSHLQPALHPWIMVSHDILYICLDLSECFVLPRRDCYAWQVECFTSSAAPPWSTSMSPSSPLPPTLAPLDSPWPASTSSLVSSSSPTPSWFSAPSAGMWTPSYCHLELG